ncbi:class I glutamine amidotransferase-like protein [Trichoderma sp. SZMC 28015]
MDTTFNLLVLEFELPADEILDVYGTYGDIISNCLHKCWRYHPTASPILNILKRSVFEEDVLPLWNEIHGLLLLGSRYTASDDDPWVTSLIRTIQMAYIVKIPMIGVCYGHQIIARALGGKISRNPAGWELGVCKMDMTSIGQKLFEKDTLMVHQMHRDAVVEAPPNIDVIASSCSCKVQMMFQPGRVLTIQGHPEFDARISKSWLDQRYEEGLMEQELYGYALTKLNLEHDGMEILQAMRKFLLGTSI